MPRTGGGNFLPRGALNALPPADLLDPCDLCPFDDGGVLTLWRAVLLQLLDDAQNLRADWATEKIRARNWLTRPSPDRRFVLSAVGIEEEAFAAHGLPRLLREWTLLDEQCAAAGLVRTSEAVTLRRRGRPPRSAALQGSQARAA